MPLYSLVRPLLFRCDPERAHHLALAALRLAGGVPGAAAVLGRGYGVEAPELRQRLLGLDFENPVGLAAGFDKNAAAIRGVQALGFGFAEVGTVTPLPQAGNPKPRIFRHPAERSLQNALGFNNDGMEAVARRLAAWRRHHGRGMPLGVNVGKGRSTPPEAAAGDYAQLIERLGPLADYLVVNVSSPNTPSLRDLQNERFIRELLRSAPTRTPVLVKLSPDLEPEAAATLSEVAVDAGAAGIVATNTSTDRSLVPAPLPAGGISGRVLKAKSLAATLAIARRLQGRAILVSVGGIDSGEEAYRRLRAGASLVQVYTALIYEGPTLAGKINRELQARLRQDGLGSLTAAIGADL